MLCISSKLLVQFFGISHANYIDILCLHFLVSYVLNVILKMYFCELELCVQEREREIDLCPANLAPEERPEHP